MISTKVIVITSSLEALLFSKHKFLLDSVELALEESVSFQVKVVLIKPLTALLSTVKRLKVRVLDISTAIAHDQNQAHDERALTHRESHRLDEIPSEPRHAEDGVVTNAKLSSEEGC